MAEIEAAVAALPRDEQAELLRFVAANLYRTGGAPAKTGAQLAERWPRLAHLAPDEAAAFERNLAAARASEAAQSAPAWE